MNDAAKQIAFALLVIVIATVIVIGHRGTRGKYIPDTTRVVVFDTVHVRRPVPVDSAVVRYVTKVLEVDSTVIHADTIHFADSAAVVIPITQKTYVGNTYRAYVSGYLPALDSIAVVNSKTYIRTKVKKHWGVTIGVQAGYGITPHGADPYLGAGFTAGYTF